jgi:parallel beta-helix repeat protein
MSPFRPHGVRLLAVLLLAAPLRADTLKVPQQFATIQAAVNVAASGDVIQVSKGVYRENVVVNTAGIALRGKSGAVVVGTYVGNCILVTANDVEVSGFTLVNGGVSQAALTADLAPPTGCLQVTGTGAKLSKLDVRAGESFGIHLEGTGTIEKCTVDGCAGNGIWVQTGNSLGTDVTSISKCEVHRSGIGIFAEDGPFLIEKNSADRCVTVDLYVLIPTLFADVQILVQPTLVTGNTCTDCFEYGLYVAVGAGTTTVEKNTVRGNGLGMLVAGFGEQILSNTVEDNELFGIELGASSTLVSKNKIRDNGGPGLLVSFGEIVTDGSQVGENDIDSNTVQDNGGDGIQVSSDDNGIHDNVLKDNLGDGIQLISGVASNDVTDNAISGNGHDGLDNWGLTTLIQGNTSKDNGGADLAGKGDGNGTTANGSGSNTTGDGTGLSTIQELELDIGGP